MQIMSRSTRQLNARPLRQCPPAPTVMSLFGQSAGARLEAGPTFASRSHVTRFLHLLLLLIVANQLLGSQFMDRPLPGEDADWPFVLHEWVGMAGFAVIVLFWIWTFVRHRSETSAGRLVPWCSPSGWRDVLVDARQTARNIMALKASGGRAGAFVSAVHGLGLIIASAMAASGTGYFLLFEGTSLGSRVIGIHKFLANFMWAYLIGHASMAALHAMLGDDVFARMFWMKRRKTDLTECR
jgi:cytochrome b561